jgi:hypothetical protein
VMVAAVLMMADAWPVCRMGMGEEGVGRSKGEKEDGRDNDRPQYGWLGRHTQRSLVVDGVATESGSSRRVNNQWQQEEGRRGDGSMTSRSPLCLCWCGGCLGGEMRDA